MELPRDRLKKPFANQQLTADVAGEAAPVGSPCRLRRVYERCSFYPPCYQTQVTLQNWDPSKRVSKPSAALTG